MKPPTIRKIAGVLCQPRFWTKDHPPKPQPAVISIDDRHYCAECLLERLRNDTEFAAQALALLLARLA